MYDEYEKHRREFEERLAWERARHVRERDYRLTPWDIEEPVKRRKKQVKKIKTIETLQLFKKKGMEEFSSDNATWLIKTDGVWIHSPKKVNAENSIYFPMATIEKIKIHREKINPDNALQKYLEQNLK